MFEDVLKGRCTGCQLRPRSAGCLSNKFGHRVVVVGLGKIVERQVALRRCSSWQVKVDEPLIRSLVREETLLDQVSQHELRKIPMRINKRCRETGSKEGEKQACEKVRLA